MPAYVMWFAQNFTNIMANVGRYTGTVFMNMGKNAGNFVMALVGALKGDGFNFQWTGLTDGFTSTLAALPVIAERELGPLEARTQAAVDAMWAKLGVSANAMAAETSGALAGVKGIELPKIEAPKLDGDVAAIGEMKIDNPMAAVNAGLKDTADKAKEAKSAVDSLNAIMSGSAEAQQAAALSAYGQRTTVTAADMGAMADAGAMPAPAPTAAPVPAPLPVTATKPMQETNEALAVFREMVALIATGNGHLANLVRANKTSTAPDVVTVSMG